MIKKTILKKMLKKEYKKKIGDKAIAKLDQLAAEYIRTILRSASRKADIHGRISIKETDF